MLCKCDWALERANEVQHEQPHLQPMPAKYEDHFECSSLDQVLFFPFRNCRKSKDRTLKLSMTGEESVALLPLLAPSEGIPESGKI